MKSFLIVIILSICSWVPVIGKQKDLPNIIFFLADDVGWSDLSYNVNNPVILTPYIDQLAHKGIQLKQLYSHSLCTPSRAALMTGRYHVNTELTYVLSPGTPAGLPDDIPTFPQLLKRESNYSTAMIGKWHLGNAQMKQTPIGKGFDFFTGIYMWDIDSYTKQMHEAPWADPMMIDWVVQYQNGSFRHFAEPLHATEAITKESMKTISKHASSGVNNPLFLYVPFTAAHSPLQPIPRHAQRCHHIPHPWRREFCGMVVGLDEAIQNITEHARKELGENTIVIVASDNGGSPWFGGMNVPLRGSKITPLEGGVRVPGLIYDMSSNQRYLGSSSSTGANKDDSSMERKYFGLMHFADWFPTILSFAGIPSTSFPPGLDGFDMSKTFPNVPYTKKNKEREEWGYSVSPRQEMLLEMYYANESIYRQELVAYRMNDYKLIKGTIRDINYYEETTSSLFLNISSASWLTRFYELFHHFMETFFFDEAAYDHYRLRLTHGNMQRAMTIARKQEGKEEFIRLYNIRDDPRETTNLVHENWTKPIITAIEERIEYYRLHRRIPQSPWLQFPLLTTWAKTHVPGDCSMNRERIPDDRLCRFAHPWIPDDVDPWKTGEPLIESTVHFNQRVSAARNYLIKCFFYPLLLLTFLRYLVLNKGRKSDSQ